MATDRILEMLLAERHRIDNAIAALRATDKAEITPAHVAAKRAPAKKQAKRHMSAEGRARIAAATKERWARLRAIKEGKASSKKSSAKK